jgi:hypothetical protein
MNPVYRANIYQNLTIFLLPIGFERGQILWLHCSGDLGPALLYDPVSGMDYKGR